MINMTVVTHGYLPRTFQKGLEIYLKKPENLEWMAKMEERLKPLVESINDLDQETKDIWLEELRKLRKNQCHK